MRNVCKWEREGARNGCADQRKVISESSGNLRAGMSDTEQNGFVSFPSARAPCSGMRGGPDPLNLTKPRNRSGGDVRGAAITPCLRNTKGYSAGLVGNEKITRLFRVFSFLTRALLLFFSTHSQLSKNILATCLVVGEVKNSSL